ncbi:MAG TPA: hypothetical protein EYP53_05500 [Candidatus Latescibacteria bacterium]|nr:hypothetical protein [Candidatus Latescibacterota bacterium]
MEIEIRPPYVVVGDEKLPLISGEFHYWRVNKLYWQNILDRIREAGFRVVSTYVPFNFHEYDQGRFDFKGETYPTRDLVGFLRLCKEKGLRVLLRPGPIIMAEWRHMGLPDHVQNDPNLKVSTGGYRFHPTFEQKLEEYFRNLCEDVCPLQWPDGPIILWQIDNEMGGIGYIKAEDLVGPEVELYRAFLSSTYGTIEALNEAYGKTFSSFEQIPFPEGPEDLPRVGHTDMYAFGDFVIRTLLERYGQRLREKGVKVPFYANFTVAPRRDWASYEERVDLVGIDIYLHDLIPWEEFLFFSRTIKAMAATLKLPWCPEFQSGIWPHLAEKHGAISSRHIYFMTLSAVALGLKGLNYYMLVNRDNWYFAPIDEQGTPPTVAYPEQRTAYTYLRKALRIIRENRLLEYDRHTEIALIWYRPHYLEESQQKGICVPEGLTEQELGKRCYFDYKEFWDIFRALHERDIDFDIVDLQRTSVERLKGYKAVLYAGKEVMDQESQIRLRGYVESGGRLLSSTPMPSRDLRGKKCEELYGVPVYSDIKELFAQIPANGTRSGVEGVLTYIHHREEDKILYVINTRLEDVEVRLEYPKRAFDLIKGEEVEFSKLLISGKDVRVFRI